MGLYLFDQYSYLHFAVGIIAYFWNMGWKTLFVLHVLFELIENTPFGMYIANNLPYWPGGKPKADTIINQIGDTMSVLIGWWSAYYIDKTGNKYGWYKPHIKHK